MKFIKKVFIIISILLILIFVLFVNFGDRLKINYIDSIKINDSIYIEYYDPFKTTSTIESGITTFWWVNKLNKKSSYIGLCYEYEVFDFYIEDNILIAKKFRIDIPYESDIKKSKIY